jgi:hypothetical protein
VTSRGSGPAANRGKGTIYRSALNLPTSFRSSSATVTGLSALPSVPIVFAVPLDHDHEQFAERTESPLAGRHLASYGNLLPTRPSTTFPNIFSIIRSILWGAREFACVHPKSPR